MAKILFQTQPGMVKRVVLTERGTLPGSVQILTGTQILRSGLAVITGIRGGHAVNHQLQISLGRDVYLYSFGDHPGQITLSGIGFTGLARDGCEEGSLSHNDEAGIDVIRQFFDAYKASRLDTSENSEIPLVKVRIGTQIHSGLLVDLQYAIDDASSMLAKFSMTLKTLPEI